MLIHDFFNIKNKTGDDNEWVYRLSLNAGHPIYHAHFKGNPITPGACIMQMFKEIAEYHFSTSYFIRNIKNVKFLIAINPAEHQEIDVQITYRTEDNGQLSLSAMIKNEKTVFCKANLVLSSGYGKDAINRVSTQKKPELQDQMDFLRICIVIPTYNNAKTLTQALNDVLKYTHSIIVVNDGATDDTSEILADFSEKIDIVSYSQNKGKGYALKVGFDRAEASGYQSVITLDSDGQHFASDIKAFVEMAETCPDTFFAGQRMIEGQMPSGNNFANKFSNFWFTVQTGRRLKDTQNGFRLYPLAAMKGMRPLTSRYEAELELLVRSAWKGIPIRPVPVNVYYPPENERISHFRSGKDFFRISLLNTLFSFLAIIYGYPSMLCHQLFKRS
ncbi:MAG: glycosyltransferase family 2 protein [Bacteroidales bacterium]|jgi:3-hydroxymyristoyl/3-hydroxydecanoyl-(acyl carrier protein) dehydratase|nr:glycosyltransferase family 2 protein [Bacteroidales bacterium]